MLIKVLIAENSEFIRNFISKVLSSHETIKAIITAKSEEETMRMIKEHRPDILFLDLMLEMKGIEVFSKIMEEFPIPTIILSTTNPENMDSSIQALLIGAIDYIVKPIKKGTLDLPEFEKELISKVLIASKSQIKKIIENENLLDRNISFRQSNINEALEFGKMLSKIRSDEYEPKKKEKKQPLSHVYKSREDKKGLTLRQKAINEVFRNAQIKKELVPVKEQRLNIESEQAITKSDIIYTKIEPYKPKILKKRQEIKPIHRKSLLYKRRSKTKNKAEPVEEEIKELIAIKPVEETFVKVKMEEYLLDIAPINKVHIANNVILIGASVGGPRTIQKILREIPKNIPSAILIVQHLNTPFIDTFVNTLNKECSLKIKVAKDGELPISGTVYVAPGNKHMEISVENYQPCIKIYMGKPVNFCMPSIDVLFISAARVYKERAMGILLTGMGKDGVIGLGVIQKLGGKTISESKETCVLYGMPKNAAERGVADKILPNYLIKDFVITFAKYMK